MCFSVAVNISHQLKKTVLYIDTKGGMCANRLLQMLQTKTPNMEEQVIKVLFFYFVPLFQMNSICVNVDTFKLYCTASCCATEVVFPFQYIDGGTSKNQGVQSI